LRTFSLFPSGTGWWNTIPRGLNHSFIHGQEQVSASVSVNGMAFGSTIQKATFRSKKDGCGVESMATVHSFILFLGEVLLWMEDEIPVGAKAGSTIEKSWR
jgi:hypothetical protein